MNLDLDEQDITEVQRDTDSSTRHGPVNVEDYIFRGDELEDYSLYELAMLIYSQGTAQATMERYRLRDQPTTQRRARQWNRRVFFQSGHSQSNSSREPCGSYNESYGITIGHDQ